MCLTFCMITHRCISYKWGSSEPGCKCGMTTAFSVGVVNSLSYWMVCPWLKLPVALLYPSETSLSLALNFWNGRHEGSPGTIRGATSIYTMATRAGVEDRWVVGVGWPACAIANRLLPLWQQMSVEQGGCRRVSVALWQGTFGWCQGLIPSHHRSSLHQHPSGGK